MQDGVYTCSQYLSADIIRRRATHDAFPGEPASQWGIITELISIHLIEYHQRCRRPWLGVAAADASRTNNVLEGAVKQATSAQANSDLITIYCLMAPYKARTQQEIILPRGWPAIEQQI